MESNTEAVSPSEPIEIDAESDLASSVSKYDVVLVDFYADWCGPCKMMEPAVQAVANDTDAAIVKVDVDRFQNLAAQYGVQGIPTSVLFADGEPVERMVGMQTEDRLTDVIAAHSN